MKRSLSQFVTGERIPHPDADPELYDLLTLVSGPWTEARFRVSSPRVVKARHWLTFAESLAETATIDVKTAERHLNDKNREMNAKTPDARMALARGQLATARAELTQAKKVRAEARKSLLLD